MSEALSKNRAVISYENLLHFEATVNSDAFTRALRYGDEWFVSIHKEQATSGDRIRIVECIRRVYHDLC